MNKLPLIWHIFKVCDNPFSKSQPWPPLLHLSPTEIKTIPIQISFIKFSKFHVFVFFKSKFSTKSSVFPYTLIQKKLCWTHILWLPPFPYNNGEARFSSPKCDWKTMNITFAKIKKNKKKIRCRFFKTKPSRHSWIRNTV